MFFIPSSEGPNMRNSFALLIAVLKYSGMHSVMKLFDISLIRSPQLSSQNS